MGELDGEGVTEGVAPVDSVLVGEAVLVHVRDCVGVPEGVGESVRDALDAVGEGEVEGDPDNVGDGVPEGVDEQPSTSANVSTASVRIAYGGEQGAGKEQGGAGAQGGAPQDLAHTLGALLARQIKSASTACRASPVNALQRR